MSRDARGETHLPKKNHHKTSHWSTAHIKIEQTTQNLASSFLNSVAFGAVS